jgi:hypothetical protein
MWECIQPLTGRSCSLCTSISPPRCCFRTQDPGRFRHVPDFLVPHRPAPSQPLMQEQASSHLRAKPSFRHYCSSCRHACTSEWPGFGGCAEQEKNFAFGEPLFLHLATLDVSSRE